MARGVIYLRLPFELKDPRLMSIKTENLRFSESFQSPSRRGWAMWGSEALFGDWCSTSNPPLIRFALL